MVYLLILDRKDNFFLPIIFCTFSSVSDNVRNVAANKNALIIPKGIDKFPDNTGKMTGFIDVWWIVRILFRL